MFTEHFSLKCDPFRVTPDPRFYFASKGHEAAVRAVLAELALPGGLTVLTSAPGCGKTMVLRYLLNQLRRSRPVALLSHGHLDGRDFLHSVTTGLGSGGGTELAYCLQGMERLAVELPPNNRPVILVDEADGVTDEVLTMIPGLLDARDPSGQALCGIVMAGGEQLPTRIRAAEGAPTPRNSIRIPALNPDEVSAYVEFRLRTAGCSGDTIFEPAALRRIAELSDCIARRINTLCDKGLLLAALDGSAQVNVAMVEQAADESAIGAIPKHSQQPAPIAPERRPVASPTTSPDPARRRSLIDAFDAAMDAGRIGSGTPRSPAPRAATSEPAREPPQKSTPSPLRPPGERPAPEGPSFDADETVQYSAAPIEEPAPKVAPTPPPEQAPEPPTAARREPAPEPPAATQREPASMRAATTDRGIRQRSFGAASDALMDDLPPMRPGGSPSSSEQDYAPGAPVYPGEPPPRYPYEDMPKRQAPKSNSAAILITLILTGLVSFGTYLQSPVGEEQLRRIQDYLGIPPDAGSKIAPQELRTPVAEAVAPTEDPLPPPVEELKLETEALTTPTPILRPEEVPPAQNEQIEIQPPPEPVTTAPPEVVSQAPVIEAPPPPNPLDQIRKERARELLELAAKQIRERKLTVPRGDNAFETYQRVFELIPDHPGARKGLRTIAGEYLEWAQEAEQKGLNSKAGRYYQRALSVLPDLTEAQAGLTRLKGLY